VGSWISQVDINWDGCFLWKCGVLGQARDRSPDGFFQSLSGTDLNQKATNNEAAAFDCIRESGYGQLRQPCWRSTRGYLEDTRATVQPNTCSEDLGPILVFSGTPSIHRTENEFATKS